MRVTSPRPARWYRAAGAVLLSLYFVRMSLANLQVHFAPDDPMNLSYYWRLPLWQQLFGPLMPWQTLYRPLAGWFLLPILHFFGLNPVAFHAGLLAVLLANVLVLYRLTRLLRSGERAAWLVAVIACYHVGLNNLYYSIAFVFDVLCGFFFAAALLYYVRIRERDAVPTWRQVAVLLAMYLAALDAKEMAVTLPIVLLLYEYFYRAPLPWRPRDLVRWLRGPGRCVLAGVVLTMVSLGGRVLANGGLIHDAGYGPRLSMDRVWAFQLQSFSDLFEKWGYFGQPGIVALWVAIFYIAWRRPRPLLRFACLCLLLTPLPIEFLIGRAQGCLYIPMMFWAMFVSVVFVDVADGVARFLAGEPAFRKLGAAALSALLVVAGAGWWMYRNEDLKRRFVDPAISDFAPRTWTAMQQLKAIRPTVRPRSTVVFLDDSFGTWDMLFIAELQFRDRTVDIRLNRQTPLSPADIAKADYVFDYRDDHLIELR